MPQLPSGRQLAIVPTPLAELLSQAAHVGNVHKVMAIKTFSDVMRYVDVLYLVPEVEAQSAGCELKWHVASLPIPEGMTCVSGGYCLADWEAHAADWPAADRQAFREFLEGRGAIALRGYLANVERVQEGLRSSDDFLTKLLAAWCDVGAHPAQEEGWEESDVGTPDWDDYDMLAALGICVAVLPGREECAGRPEGIWHLQAIWNVILNDLPGLAEVRPKPAGKVREYAQALRDMCLLDAMSESKRCWLHDNVVVVCVVLGNTLGEPLRKLVPQAYGIIELVVLSPEALRVTGNNSTV